MTYLPLSFVALALSSISQVQTSPTVRIVAIGQLDGPRLRELAPRGCGPYFTVAPTDRKGGGIVYFGFRQIDDRGDDPMGIQVASFSTASIRARPCPECAGPTAERQVENESAWINLSISRRDLKLSPCLSKIKMIRW
jgi:hypothetical protein